MKYWLNIISGFFIFLCLHAFGATGDLQYPTIELTPKDRILILAPHPDDEIIACGGIIQKAVSKGIPIRIVFFTYGDNNQWSFILYRKHPVLKPGAVRSMGLIRHDEAIEADRILGVSDSDLIFLGYPDFGTLNIWYAHWGKEPPFKSMLTKVDAVPYKNAMRPGAPYKGEEVLRDLESILREFKPTKIFVSHPADHNPDHRSLYLFTRVALWNLEKEIKPELYPYLVHFKNWPKPRGYYPDKNLEPPLFFAGLILWKILNLNPEEINRKESALKAHKSQYESSSKYLSSFSRLNELFGDFQEISVSAGAPPLSLLPDHKGELMETPEELIDREQAVFLGVKEKYIQLKNDQIEFTIKFSKPLANKIGVSVFIFGYRNDKSFAEMPKIRIKLGERKCKIYDKNKIIETNDINVTRDKNQITIQMPLDALGHPQRIMASALSYMDNVPLDWVLWRIIEISE